MTTECTYCNGEGKIPTTELHRGRRVDIFVPCWRCRTTGLVEQAISEYKAGQTTSLRDFAKAEGIDIDAAGKSQF